MVVKVEEMSSVSEEDTNSSIFAGQHQIVLDSGARSSVVGVKRLRRFKGSSSMGSLLPSPKRFKFGDSRVFTIMGITRIHIIFEVITQTGKRFGRHFAIAREAVPYEVPLLLSRVSM